MKSNQTAPLISVVVPVYNVGSYLGKCLESLKSQTLKELQFVIVDDGSIDNSGEIADSYKNNAPRFEVFHIENGGVSAARNFGLKQSRGKYIQFADGDDWVDERFCEIPYKAAEENDADMVTFGWDDALSDNDIVKSKYKFGGGVVDNKTAVVIGAVYCWNKLYRRTLFDDVSYPVGRVYEDMAVTAKLVYKSRKTVCIPDLLYYYRYREDSISHSITSYRDEFLAGLQRYDELRKNEFSREIADIQLYHISIGYCGHAQPDKKDELYVKASGIVDGIKGIPKSLECNKRIMLRIWKISKPLFHMTYRMMGKKIEKKT